MIPVPHLVAFFDLRAGLAKVIIVADTGHGHGRRSIRQR
jgi:hypothetical protein